MNMQNEIIGVFGGSGFVGLELVSQLCKSNYKIKVFSRDAPSNKSLHLMGNLGQVSTYSGNVSNEKEVEDFINGCDIIINLVALFYEFGKQNFNDIHIIAPELIAKNAKKHKIKHLIHISDRWADENSFSKSSRSRGVAEKSVQKIFENTTIIRLDVLFGKNDGLFFRFAKMIKTLPIIPIPLESKAVFAPLYVKDVTKGIDFIIKNDSYHGKFFEFFGPESYSWSELMAYFKKNIKTKIYLLPIPIAFLSLPAFFFGFLPKPLITIDQLRRFKVKIKYDPDHLSLKDLNIQPSLMEVEMQKYLKNF
jgi:NADH dehydrogenase